MKIALAQTKPVRGNIAANIAAHVRIVGIAAERHADFLVFPELSLTGYEPQLAGKLATDPDDSRLEVFQRLSDRNQMIIGVGLPTRASPRPWITLLVFSPDAPRRTYSKRYLHADEEPYFSAGPMSLCLVGAPPAALAICYEISVLLHAEAAFASGAKLYVSSVAKTADGVDRAHLRLAEIARHHRAPVLMANCVGPSGDGDCAGGSAAWNRKGELVGRLGPADEGLLVFDSTTEQSTI